MKKKSYGNTKTFNRYFVFLVGVTLITLVTNQAFLSFPQYPETWLYSGVLLYPVQITFYQLSRFILVFLFLANIFLALKNFCLENRSFTKISSSLIGFLYAFCLLYISLDYCLNYSFIPVDRIQTDSNYYYVDRIDEHNFLRDYGEFSHYVVHQCDYMGVFCRHIQTLTSYPYRNILQVQFVKDGDLLHLTIGTEQYEIHTATP